jgi:ribosomal protein S18 acetylase RimI-like enzyme
MITLQRITAKNVMAYKDVRLRALLDSPSAFIATHATESQFSDTDWESRAMRWTRPHSIGYLAVVDDYGCGIACGFVDETDRSQAHLVSLWVAPACRHLGIGRLLVDSILAWADTQDARILLLTVTSNNEAAIRFYRRLGFSLTGEKGPYVNDPTLCNLEMARPVHQAELQGT